MNLKKERENTSEIVLTDSQIDSINFLPLSLPC